MIPQASALRTRGVYPFLSASFISNVGTEISGIALPLIAITLLGASNAWIASIDAATAVALLIVALPIGVLTDRVNRRSILFCADISAAILVSAVLLLWGFGHLTIGIVLALVVSIQILGSLHDVAAGTVAPALVSDRNLDRVNSVYASSRSVAEISGSGFGGLLLSTCGLYAGLIADALSFFVSAGVLLRLPRNALNPTPNTPPTRGNRDRGSITVHATRMTREFLIGFRIYWSNPRLRLLLASSVTSNAFSTVAGAVEFLYLIRELEVPAWGVGLAVCVTAVGGVFGGLVYGFLVRTLGPIRIVVFTQLVLNVPILLLPLAFPGLGVIFYVVGWFFYSMSSVVYGSAVLSFSQRAVPREALGRLGATSQWINSLAIGTAAIATAVALTCIGLRLVVLISSIGIYVSGFWLLNRHFLVSNRDG